MSELSELTARMPPGEQVAAALGYALGYAHADNGKHAELRDDAPEWRIVEIMLGH
jgi:hypothetical protein